MMWFYASCLIVVFVGFWMLLYAVDFAFEFAYKRSHGFQQFVDGLFDRLF